MGMAIRIRMLSEPYMQRALLVALCMGPLCALMGVFVTARRMAFFSDTISHGALAGVALGFWMGFSDPTVPMIVFSLMVAGVLVWLQENTELLSDTILAVVLSGSVALGIVILSSLKGYRGEIQSYLFGDILAIGWADLRLGFVLLVVVSFGLFSNLTRLTLVTAHPELAHSCGVPVRILNYVFVVALTFVVTLSIRLLGIILVTSLLVIPPAAARSLSCNLRQQICFSVLLGLVASLGGVVGSYHFDAPCGPMIVLVCLVLFVAAFLFGRLKGRVRP